MTRYFTPPQHGERRCYLRGCRRPECMLADQRYRKTLAVDHLRNGPRRRDATQARVHIERLIANKWSQADIARAAGIHRSTLSVIAQGQALTSRQNIQAILSIPIAPFVGVGPQVRLDATGTMRRLRALAFLGHTWLAIGARTGITEDRLGDIACGYVGAVRPTEARLISSTYRELSKVSGACKQVASAARNKGWHGPLAWDDIDNPSTCPEISKPYQPTAGNGRDSMRMEELKHLLALGESEAAIAKQMGSSEAYIHDLAVALRNRRKTDTAAAA